MRSYIRAANVGWDGISVDDIKEMDFSPVEHERFRLRRGDILIVEGSGSAKEVGKPAVWDNEVPECCFQNTLIRVRVVSSHVPFLYQHFRADAVSGAFARNSKGIGIHHIGAKALSEWKLSIPPLNEQRRIVAKIETLQARSDAAKAALDAIPKLLETFRQSVLAAAFRGDLTREWRAKNPEVEPASVLLTRIRTERKARFIETAAEKARAKAESKARAAGKPWTDAGDTKTLAHATAKAEAKYQAPEPVDPTGLPALPKGWCWARVNEVGAAELGRQRSPKHHSGPHMRPYLRVKNVFEDRIDVTDVMEMNFDPAEFERYKLVSGDILLNEGQSKHLVGRPAMYRNEIDGACFTNTLIRFRPKDGIDRMYALLLFRNYMRTGRFEKIAKITTNIAHLGVERFRNVEFPIPPAEEQLAIAKAVSIFLDAADAIQATNQAAQDRLKSLNQSILAKAFRGELVPQDPNDEPASVLLDRIRAERAQADADAKAAKSAARATKAKSKSKKPARKRTP